MTCQFCDDGDLGEDDQVEDRPALMDFVAALLAGDIRLARIMAARNFSGTDLAEIDAAMIRAPALKKEILNV